MIHAIIFDWKGTLYNSTDKKLIEGALEILNYFARLNVRMFLVGKGGIDMHEEVQRLDVKKYFQEVMFVDGTKTPDLFIKYIDNGNPKSTIVIGDRIKSELKVGNSIWATTIWVRQGKFASEEPENDQEKPTHVVNNLLEILNIEFDLGNENKVSSESSFL
jgi:ribonucleotide monophosphatase NagD (HAD superfamily)